MRILICSVEAPLAPLDGLGLQVAALLRELRREHDVRVLSFVRPAQRQPEAPSWMRLVPRPGTSVSSKVRNFPRALLGGRPLGVELLAARLHGPLLEELVRFDPHVVHVTSGQLALLADALGRRPAVLAALDAWHLNVEADLAGARGLRRLLLPGEAARVRRFEATAYRRFDRVIMVTEGDAEELVALDPSLSVAVIPNGVDAGEFSPPERPEREPDLVLFTGVMRYSPNVTAAEFLVRRVFPRIRDVRPHARLALVGRDPAQEVVALGAEPGVEVLGEVREMRSWLSRSSLYICPMLSGTGIKNKLLEAMANELPCVATPLAVRGLRVTPGVHLAVGAEDQELARHALRLLCDPIESGQMGREGARYVRSEHSWEAVARAYVREYEAALALYP